MWFLGEMVINQLLSLVILISVYAQSQQGYINRVDRTTGEAVNIRPHEGIDEPYERFNWDCSNSCKSTRPETSYISVLKEFGVLKTGEIVGQQFLHDLTKNEERLSLANHG